MTIGLYNADKRLLKSLSAKISIIELDTSFPKLKGLFIDWVDTINRKKPSKKFAHQAALISYYSKKNIPIMIYDRHMCITQKELKWLKKFYAHLFEPALNNRRDFEYLPYCIEMDDNKLLDYEGGREYHLGHIGLQTDSFEKYYVGHREKFPDSNVHYKVEDWEEIKYMVAIDSKHNYSIGYLNQNIIDALEHGCMVLCPIEHKYYSNMFYGNVVGDINFIDYWMNMNHDMRIASIMGVYENVKERYPEFTIEYWAKRIIEVFDK